MASKRILILFLLVSFTLQNADALFGGHAFKLRSLSVMPKIANKSPFALKIADDERKIDSSESIDNLRAELMTACDRFRDEQNKQWDLPSLSSTNTSSGLFGSQSRAENSVILNQVGEEVLKLVDKVSKLNPTSEPLRYWKSLEGRGEDCMLHGLWKLRFTTAADATFKPGKRGPASTSQIVNATEGTLTNIIEFRENNGTLRSFNVVVEGDKLSSRDLELNFRRIIINREPRRWLAKRLFKKITIPLPNFKILERITRRKDQIRKRRTTMPGFEILYLDEDLRIHKTNQGEIFVQSRLYDVWDPAEKYGWKKVSAI